MEVPASQDLRFAVPFTHRVRFTANVMGDDAGVLLDLLESPPGQRPRVLAIVERGLDEATRLADAIARQAARHGDRLHLLETHIFDGGEACKNDPANLLPIFDRIREHGLDRRSYVLAAGGGAFLDAVGLAAALAHRGLRLIRLPTTTLSQADSGVGVKNAINFFGKKNWLGTFAVPWAVINDRQLLATLPHRDFCCGFAEAVKVALLKDAAFFGRLCANAGKIRGRDSTAVDDAIRYSAWLHLQHIAAGGDAFETREARPLDFGHWAAHQIEAMTNFDVRHGEAVAIGLAIDCIYSSYTTGLPAAAADQVLACLRGLGQAISHPCLADGDRLLAGLEEFRQHLGGRLTVTMLRDVGQPIDVNEIDRDAMRRAIASL